MNNNIFFYEKTKPVTLASEEFNTTRLRCGYIEEEYIVLSPRRKDAGNAYLIYSFNNNITQMIVELCYNTKMKVEIG